MTGDDIIARQQRYEMIILRTMTQEENDVTRGSAFNTVSN